MNSAEILRIFRRANAVSEQELIQLIREAELNRDQVNAMLASINGRPDELNTRLFELRETPNKPFAWIAPVQKNGRKQFAWVIGRISTENRMIDELFESHVDTMHEDSVLRLDTRTPPVLFVDREECAVLESPEDEITTTGNEFNIFQVGENRSDQQEQMILSTTALQMAAQRAIQRIGLESDESDSKLAIVHAEGHNRGHFSGPWPFDDEKNIEIYEAVEEMRACLAAIYMTRFFNMNQKMRERIAILVFAIRFAFHAANVWKYEERNKASIREITVSLMMYSIAKRHEAITHRGNRLEISPTTLLGAFEETFREVRKEEETAREDQDNLARIGERWLNLAYPNAQIPQFAEEFWHHVT